MRNPYDILGVKADATQKRIKKAYDKEVKYAQRNIANKGALKTKLSELSWALTELLNENSRDKYEVPEIKEIKIKEEVSKPKTKNIVLKYTLCILLALLLCIKTAAENSLTTDVYSYDEYGIILHKEALLDPAIFTVLAVIRSFIGLWLIDLIIKKMFATSEESYTAHKVIQWIVIILNSITFINAVTLMLQKHGGQGFDTISHLVPDTIGYIIIIIATLFFVYKAKKQKN